MKAGRLLAAMAALGVAMLLAWPRISAGADRIRRSASASPASARRSRRCTHDKSVNARFGSPSPPVSRTPAARDAMTWPSCGARPTRSTRRSASSVPSGAARPSGTTRPRKRHRPEPWRRSRRVNLAPCRCNGHQRPPQKPARTPRANSARPPQARSQAPVGTPAPSSVRADEAKNRASFEERQREAQAHRDEVTRRNEELAARRKPAAPLPLPAASSP